MHMHKEFLVFLKEVESPIAAEKQLYFITDNDATHKHEKFRRGLKRNKRVQLHITPNSSSWLKLIDLIHNIGI